MSLAILIKSLENDLSRNLPRNHVSFAETRARRPELSPFETVGDIQSALDSSSSLTTNARRSLVAALVEEAQTGTSALWSSVLVLAFAPMMHRLRSHIGRPFDADLDSAVLVAFLSAVRTVRPGPFTSLALRWATEKAVLNGCRADRQLGPMAPFDDETYDPKKFRETESSNTFDEVLRVLEKEGAAEILDVLIATRGRDESLRAYVARTCANPRARGARYEHLCRARLRLEREIRERITPRAA